MNADLGVRFAEPQWLLALAAPGVLLLLWMWQLWRRGAALRAFRRVRRVPAVFARGLATPGAAFAIGFGGPGPSNASRRFGDLPFWLSMLVALALTILALARPVVVTSVVRTGGVDIVILQDGSASMRVRDVSADRWERSMRFLRTLGESLRWEHDRIALALFATTATPQIRLTRDPNTFFFFLDHLGTEPPFRLEDEGTWNTNIERGIHWGLRVIEKDEEIRGPSTNGRAFILLSDGQAWSGTGRAVHRAGPRGSRPAVRGRRRHDRRRDHPRATAGGQHAAAVVGSRPRLALRRGHGRRRTLLRARPRAGLGHRERRHRGHAGAGAVGRRRRGHHGSCTGASWPRPRDSSCWVFCC